MRKRLQGPSPRAFTLIELLTIIAMIAIPAATLIPVAKAQTIECTPHLRQIGTQGYCGNALTPVHGNVRNALFFDGHIEA
jgi:prepilin-type processing-associated H-X9-DG protein